MAARHPGWVNGIEAAEARLATGLLVTAERIATPGDVLDALRVRTGIRHTSGEPGLVTVNANKVTVNPFQAVIANPANPVGGAFLVTSDTVWEFDLAEADDQDHRMDLVVAEVTEPDENVRVVVQRGVESPTEPPPRPTPANPNSLVLAEITVPPVNVGAPWSRDTRRFTAALGGIIPVLNGENRPENPHRGMITYRLDTGVIEVPHGDGWVNYPPRDDWHPPQLVNDWMNYSSGTGSFSHAGYTRTADGWVRLRGLIRGGAVDGRPPEDRPIFVLPPGYRPVFRHVFPVSNLHDGLVAQMGRVDVLLNGKVIPTSVSVDDNGDANWLSLEGIAFATY